MPFTVTNWFGDVVSHPAVLVEANSVDDLAAILRDSEIYPAPVRAVGSNHSTSACGTADAGTLVRIKMNKILNIGPDSTGQPALTVEAGITHLEMANALRAKGLQFYVNTEIGSLSAGSAACAGTKDASFPGEFGQVGSYVIAVKMVLPNGTLLEADEATQPGLMQLIRSSYGLFGIVYEVTFRVRPLLALDVHHVSYSLNDFLAKLPEFKALNLYSLMFYMFPFEDKITVEFRKYNLAPTGDPNCCVWPLRNHIWGTSGPKFGYDTEANIADPIVRYGIIDAFNAAWRLTLENIVVSDNTIPPDQIIDYPPVSNDSRYTFSLFAFPEPLYPKAITDFYAFSKTYYAEHNYRSNLLDVGYAIAQDQKALLSYSYDGPVITLDPVSTGNSGWPQFLDAYNQFCIDHGGIPLLNQTPGLTAAMLNTALGPRLETFRAARKQYDPTDRMLNPYFRELLAD